MFQVGFGADRLDLRARIFALEQANKQPLIFGPSGPLRGGAAVSAIGRDFEDLGFRLPKSQERTGEAVWPGLDVEHAAHDVALFRPDVQNALAFTGNGIASAAEIEQHVAVFDQTAWGASSRKLSIVRASVSAVREQVGIKPP